MRDDALNEYLSSIRRHVVAARKASPMLKRTPAQWREALSANADALEAAARVSGNETPIRESAALVAATAFLATEKAEAS